MLTIHRLNTPGTREIAENVGRFWINRRGIWIRAFGRVVLWVWNPAPPGSNV